MLLVGQQQATGNEKVLLQQQNKWTFGETSVN